MHHEQLIEFGEAGRSLYGRGRTPFGGGLCNLAGGEKAALHIQILPTPAAPKEALELLAFLRCAEMTHRL